ncbi:LSM6 [Candida jiufengensis]|uniref:LSM6 n=1 Tax=Candida jiufengensis TaxID=497108 RepID=UPI0022250582|nr:LSM6 [Candida jiufengensis]KAI5950856.1 LSM6 [Candida jiufengensis]
MSEDNSQSIESQDFNRIDPSKFLSNIIGSSVIVKLHNGIEYKGDLQTIDGYMNVVLENGKEIINGNVTKDYGDIFLRGNNGGGSAAKRMAEVVKFYKKLPQGPASTTVEKSTNPLVRYRQKYFDGDNASGKPLIHLAIIVIIFGYTLEYEHLKHAGEH